MASSQTVFKVTLVITALIITSTILVSSPIQAKEQSIQWTLSNGSTVNAGYPALSPNGDLYTYSGNGVIATVYSISPEGKNQWNVSVVLASMPHFSSDGTIFIFVDVSSAQVNGTGLIVMTPQGTTKWTYIVPGVSEGMRVLPDGGIVLGGMAVYPGQPSLTCLNADGSVRWTKGGFEENLTNPMIYPVGIRGNDVLVASTSFSLPSTSVITEYAPDGTVVRSFSTDFAPQAISFAQDGTMRTVGYNFTHGTDYEYLYGLGVDGSVMWMDLLGNQYGGLTVLPDGTTVYGELTSTSGLNLNIFAVDRNGEMLWKASNAKSIPVAFGNGVIFSNSTGLMLVDRYGAIDWKLDGSFYGQPVVNDDTIYAGNGTNLVAISETAWKLTWQPLAIMLTAMAAMIGVVLLGGRTPE